MLCSTLSPGTYSLVLTTTSFLTIMVILGTSVTGFGGNCPDVSRPKNGNMKGSCKYSKSGDVCSFFCLEGYLLRGKSSITCQANGYWDSSTPSCDGPVKCSDIRVPDSGSTSGFCSPGYAGQVCSFQCRSGYSLEGPSGIVCLPPVHGYTGQWNKSPPKCIKTDKATCPDLIYKNFDGGVFLGTCAPGRQGSTCELKCADGLTLEGSPSYVCQSNGQWSPNPVSSSCRKKERDEGDARGPYSVPSG